MIPRDAAVELEVFGLVAELSEVDREPELEGVR